MSPMPRAGHPARSWQSTLADLLRPDIRRGRGPLDVSGRVAGAASRRCSTPASCRPPHKRRESGFASRIPQSGPAQAAAPHGVRAFAVARARRVRAQAIELDIMVGERLEMLEFLGCSGTAVKQMAEAALEFQVIGNRTDL